MSKLVRTAVVRDDASSAFIRAMKSSGVCDRLTSCPVRATSSVGRMVGTGTTREAECDRDSRDRVQLTLPDALAVTESDTVTDSLNVSDAEIVFVEESEGVPPLTVTVSVALGSETVTVSVFVVETVASAEAVALLLWLADPLGEPEVDADSDGDAERDPERVRESEKLDEWVTVWDSDGDARLGDSE